MCSIFIDGCKNIKFGTAKFGNGIKLKVFVLSELMGLQLHWMLSRMVSSCQTFSKSGHWEMATIYKVFNEIEEPSIMNTQS